MREEMQNRGCGPMSLATAMVVLAVACGITELGAPDSWSEDEEQEGIASPFRSVCCVSGLEYPTGYDWNEDSRDGEVRCSLVVFADGVPRIEVPVGDGYEISGDMDMHRVIDGNLYTFYSKNGRTVVKRNGAPLFRYDGDEVLVDMSVKEDDVFTLAHRRLGGGFSLRKNGNVVLERLSGETFGKFWDDGDSLCFAFVQPVALTDGVEYRYYMVFDSESCGIKVTDEMERIWDLTSIDGNPYMLASLRGTGETFLFREGYQRRKIEIPDSARMLSCRFFPADSLSGTECMYLYPDGTCEGGIWVEASEYMRFEAGRSIQALEYADGKLCCILNPDDDEGIIFDAGVIERMPTGYSCMNERSVTLHEGKFHVAMSSKLGGPPLVWHDGLTDTLRFNGCVSSITFTQMPEGYYSSQVRVRD